MRHQGFSMAEMMVVVLVMSILAGISAPAFIGFLQQQRVQTEENEQQEIYRAMDVFAKRFGRLPSNDAADNDICNTTNDTWNECLAEVSSLSADQILTDVWGKERAYIHMQDTSAVLLGNAVAIDYASLFSRGPDMMAEDADGIAITTEGFETVYAEADDADWWASELTVADQLQAFRALATANDDIMVKYTNHTIKMTEYERTLMRLSGIADALETFARTKYNEASIAGEADADKKIYYPPSTFSNGTDRYSCGSEDIDNSNYGSGLCTLMPTDLFGTDRRVYNGETEDTRREEMINLMRILGLPDSYCCNAMERVEIDDEWVEPAFYYHSNPQAVASTSPLTCSARTQANDVNGAPLFMPAWVGTERHLCP